MVGALLVAEVLLANMTSLNGLLSQLLRLQTSDCECKLLYVWFLSGRRRWRQVFTVNGGSLLESQKQLGQKTCTISVVVHCRMVVEVKLEEECTTELCCGTTA